MPCVCSVRAADPGVVRKETRTEDSYARNRQIIIGTVVGGVGALLLVALACYCFHRKRVRLPGERGFRVRGCSA